MEELAVRELIEKIRQDIRFQCPIVAMIECAPGIEASNIERNIRQAGIHNVCVMSERAGYKEGVPKTEQTTMEMLYDLRRALLPGAGERQGLAYSDKVVTWSVTGQPEATWLQATKDLLKLQMNSLRKVFPKNPPEYGDVRMKITAKVNGQSDDLLIALMMALYWSGRFWADKERYGNWHEMINSISRSRTLI